MKSSLKHLSVSFFSILALSSCSVEIPFTSQSSNSNSIEVNSTVPMSNANSNTSEVGLLTITNQNTADTITAVGDIIPSRAPLEGCSWQEVKNEELGVQFLEQACGEDQTKLPFAWKENKLVRADGSADQSPIMTVFYKQGEETDEAVLKRLFVSKLGMDEQQNCELTKLDIPASTVGAVRYTIDPNDKILTDAETNGTPAWGYCGAYGWNNAKTFFEFQKDKTKFAYLDLGQDVSMIDEDTIRILK